MEKRTLIATAPFTLVRAILLFALAGATVQIGTAEAAVAPVDPTSTSTATPDFTRGLQPLAMSVQAPNGSATCAACKGGATQLVLKYTGSVAANITASSGSASYNLGLVQPGETIILNGTKSDGKFDKNEVKLFINGSQSAAIHVSCSQPLEPGMTFGSFLLTGGASKDGGEFCPLPEPPDPALVCYLVADNDGRDSSRDVFTYIDKMTGAETVVGRTGTLHMETIAFNPNTGVLYGVTEEGGEGRFGTIDLTTGVFTQIGVVGWGEGALGAQDFVDIDGLSFDPSSGVLYASVRRNGNDLLIQINPATGEAVPDAFGPGLDYVVVQPIGSLNDVDDIAVDTETGTMYAILNDGGTMSRLIIIDKFTGATTSVTDLDVENVEGLTFDTDGTLLGVLGDVDKKVVAINPSTGVTTVRSNLGAGSNQDYEAIACLTNTPNRILGTVYLDSNGNQVQDGGEPGQAGVTVELYRDVNNNGVVDIGTDILLATRDTDGSGNYEFKVASDGNFVLRIDTADLPAGSGLTTDNVEEADFVGFGQTDPDNDFGFRPAASGVSGTVFNDVNGNGNQDAGDNGIPSVTVRLYKDVNMNGVVDAGDTLVGTQVTNGSGDYAFTGLPAGNYLVDVDQTDPDLGGKTGTTTDPMAVILNGTAGDQQDVDFGFTTPDARKGSIGDTVYRDTNGNGTQDPGEPGIAGVTVRLFVDANGDGNPDTPGTPLATQVTNSGGIYDFTGLPAGNYVVDVVDPSGFTRTEDASGTTIPLAAGQDYNDADFGFLPSAGVIDGTVFDDVNGNGVQDPGEPGIPGVNVVITSNGPDGVPGGGDDVNTTVTTNGNGDYSLPGLSPGDYTVDVDEGTLPAGVTGTTTEPVTVTISGNETETVDFGYEKSLSTISGNLFDDVNGNGIDDGEPGLPNVTVYLYEDTNNDGVGDVLVASTVTNANGDYTFPNLPAGNYIVDPDNGDPDLGGRLSTTTDPLPVSVNGTNSGSADFGFSDLANKMASIGDRVFVDENGNGIQDAGEPGIPGVTINISGPGGFTDTAVTDASGFYEFTNLMPGQYTVTADDTALLSAGYLAPAGGNSTTLTVGPGDDINTVDYGYRPTGSIAGTVFGDTNSDGVQNGGEPGYPLVDVLLYEDVNGNGVVDGGDTLIATDVTDAQGDYLFTNLTAGNYLVEVNQADPQFPANVSATTPDPAPVSLMTNQNATGVDIGYGPSNSTVSGNVFDDANGNGVDDGDAGIPNVTVNLYEDTNGDGVGDVLVATTVTDGNGNYSFPGLPAGNYVVDVLNSDPDLAGRNPSTTEPLPVSVNGTPAGSATADFGFSERANKMASIGDTVFLDLNGNGIQDPGEPGVNNVTVTLFADVDMNGMPDGGALQTTTTNSGGVYDFTGLMPGSYVVQMTTPTGFSATNGTSTGTITVGAGDDYNTADFGVLSSNGKITGVVFDDLNGNGVKDVGEPGLAGVDVLITSNGPDGVPGGGDDVNTTVTTGPGGVYTLSGLEPGDYTVDVVEATLPAGVTATTTEPATTTISGNETDTVNFGYEKAQSTISGTVFDDQNGNGMEDVGEPGIDNVTVNLYEDLNGDGVGDVLVATAVTSGGGNYTFPNLPAGDYVVDVVNSDPDLGGKLSSTTEPLPVSVNGTAGDMQDADFGFSTSANKMASIGDTVFQDLNGNGVQDPGEPGLGGVILRLFMDSDMNGVADGPAIQSTTTNSGGVYDFTGLMPGTYLVVATVPAGYTGTTPATTGPITVAAGDDYNTADFGVLSSNGQITGVVFDDLNGNGVKDPGEPGLPGVNVLITSNGPDGVPGGGDDVNTTVTTGPGGVYSLPGLQPGTYTVDVVEATLPAGVTPTSTEPATTTISGNEIDTINFGYEKAQSTISGNVFDDQNGNGIDDGEPGIDGVTVNLYEDTNGDGVGDVLVATTTTAGGGNYSFPNLPAGDYVVDVLNSDPDLGGKLPSTTEPLPVSVNGTPAGSATADFGFSERANKMASIGDTVFLDLNGNGIQDPGEPGVNNVTVTLFADVDMNGMPDGGALQTTTTNSGGVYDFTGLMPGSYVVQMTTPTGFSATNGTSTGTITVGAGDDYNTADFGVLSSNGKITGVVFDDLNGNGVKDVGEPGLAGVDVLITSNGPDGVPGGGDDVNTTVTTGPGGVYTLSGLEPGDYTVDVVEATLPAGVTATTTEPATTTISGNETDTVNFGYEKAQSTISGTVFDDQNGNGMEDVGEPGIDNVTVNLYEDLNGDGVGDVLVATAVTSGGGNYTFPNLPAGDYVVDVVNSDPDLGGKLSSTTEPLPVSVNGTAGDMQDADFGFSTSANKMASIGDTVFQDLNGNGVQDPGEPGVSGVTVELFADADMNGVADGPAIRTTTTNSGGIYDFTGLMPGSYLVTMTTPAGFSPTTVTTTTTITVGAGDDYNDADFGVLSAEGEIAGVIFNDLNGNGVQDMGEPGLPGVNVLITSNGPDGIPGGGDDVSTTVTTGPNGEYSLPGLQPGTYTVDVVEATLPAGVTPTTTEPTTTTISGNETDTVSFGYEQAQSTISGNVFDDQNGNGIDDGEPGIDGVTVNLYEDTNGDGVGDVLVATTTTAGGGNYSFPNLPAGDYVVDVLNSDPDLGGKLPSTTEPLNVSVDGTPAGSDTANFGFSERANKMASIGDTVFQDLNGNGIQDPGEPGLAGVTVSIFADANMDGIPDGPALNTDVTNSAGIYEFTGLMPGSYVVNITDPAGYSRTLDPSGTTITVTAGQDYNDADFGVIANSGEIAGTVFDDLNGNGVQDMGEPGIAGVDVNVYGPGPDGDYGTLGDNVNQTTTTDANGGYWVSGLPPGSYVVTIPAGQPELNGTSATTTDPRFVTLAPNEVIENADFGFEASESAISGTVYNDANGNMTFDPGTESGIDGVPVNLYEDVNMNGTVDAGDQLVASTTTSGGGTYTFQNLPEGNYLVDVDNSSPALTGLSASTADPLPVTVNGTNSASGQNVGFDANGADTASIGDNIFQDTNGNGVQDPSEPGLAGATVKLLDAMGNPALDADGAPVPSQVTGADGNYEFSNLAPGTYQVVVTPPANHVLTFDPDGTDNNKTTVTVAAGDDYNDADFGYQPKAGMVNGTVFSDVDGDGIQDAMGEPGLNMVTVELIDPVTMTVIQTTMTDANGDYSFGDLPPGDYIINVVDPAGTVPTTTDPRTVTVGPNQTVVADAGFQPANNSISGTAFEDRNGNGVQNGSEPALAGVTVKLIEAGPDGLFGTNDDVLVATTTTDGSGNYAFTGVPSGTYQIEASNPAGLISTTTNPLTVMVDTGDTLDGDFGFNNNKMASIGDTVFRDDNGNSVQDAGEPGLAGIVVRLYTDTNNNGVYDAGTDALVATKVTNSAGIYDFTGLMPGRYFVNVVDPAGTVATGSAARGPELTAINVISGSDVNDADYGFQPKDGTVSGLVFNDLNGNGVLDPGEPGYMMVTVTITIAGPDGVLGTPDDVSFETMTNTQGEYTFNGLPPGPYSVSVDETPLPDGSTATTGNPVTGTLGASEDAEANVGFETENSSISGVVFGDSNGNGTKDGSEAGLGGVTVNLIDLGPDGVLGGGDDTIAASTTTAADGSYSFAGLPPGDYQVQAQAPAGQVATNTNPLPVTLGSGDDATASFGFNSNKMASIGDTVFQDLNGNGKQDPGEAGLPGITVNLYKDTNGNGVYNPGIDLNAGTTTTNSAGIYDFTGLNPGTYFVDVIAPSDYNGTGSELLGNELAPITVADGTDQNDADYGLLPIGGSISGVVFDDQNGNGIKDPGEGGLGGVTVVLTGNGPDGLPGTADDINLSVNSNGNGEFVFNNLPAGNYTLNPDESDVPGAQITTSDPAQITVGANNDVSSNVGFQTQDASISGTVFGDSNGNGIKDGLETTLPGVAVTLINVGGDGVLGGGDDSVAGFVVTDGSGNYTFGNLPPGNYLVQVQAPAGQVSTTTNPLPVTLMSGDDATGDFGFNNNKMASIGDTVFRDDNGNSIQDVGEPGLAGVTVKLYRDTNNNGIYDAGTDALVATKVTNSAGIYDFTGLMPGTYFVNVVDPVGTVATGSDILDAELAPITVLAGDDQNDADYGFQPKDGRVSGVVFNDLNGNGVLNPGEPGYMMVTVTITIAGPDGILGTADDVSFETMTNTQGEYTFNGLPPGPYSVSVDETPLPDGSTPTTGNPVTGTLGASQQAQANVGFETDNSSIAGVVFGDSNGNGVQDGAEAGLGGVTVNLIDLGPNGILGGGDDTIVGSTTTAGDGSYSFAGLPPGDYLVQAQPPAGQVATNTNPLPVTLGSGDDATASFGFNSNKMASIGDTVFEDLNANGKQDPGEAGLAGITVNLYRDTNGNGVYNPGIDLNAGTTITNSAGIYDFTGLMPGTYFVDVVAPTDYEGTGSELLGDELAPITVGDGYDLNDADYGLLPTGGSVSGVVFDDLNGNGVQDPGEPGIPSVTVTVYGPGPDNTYGTADDVSVDATTGPDGSYTVENLPAGDYLVNVDESDLPAGSTFTTEEPAGVWITGNDDVNVDFGVLAPRGGIEGIIFADTNQNGIQDGGEAGLPGVLITLLDLGPDGIQGTTDDGPSRTATTASDGSYSFDGLPDGQYRLNVDDPLGLVATSTEPRDVAVTAGSTETENIGYATSKMASIGDTVFQDLNGNGTQEPGEPGLDMVTVTLYVDSNGNGVLDGLESTTGVTTQTNSAGVYDFTGLMAGDYLVEVTAPAGYNLTTPPGVLPVSVINGQDMNTADFGYLPVAGSISGIVFDDLDGDGIRDAGEPGLAGVTVTLTGPGPDGIAGNADDVLMTTTTGPNGGYTFTSLPPGNYQVLSATPTGTTASTANPAGVSLGANESKQALIGFRDNTGDVAGTVFNDANGDGVKDPTEGGLPGVTVNLFGPGPDGVLGTPDDVLVATTTSAANGTYSFPNVPEGLYRLDVDGTTAPAGFNVSTGNDPTDIQVTGGGLVTVRFGFTKKAAPTATIAGKVFNDANQNGQLDPGETGYPGITVKLLRPGRDGLCGTADDVVVTSQTTGAMGTYSFTGLAGGDYCVKVIESGLPSGVVLTTGANPATVWVAVGGTQANVNFGYAGGGIDLELTKSVDKANANVGDWVTFTLNLTNSSQANVAATNVFVKDYLPTGLTYKAGSATTASGVTFNPTTNTWKVEWVGVGQTVVLSLQAKVNQAGRFKNCAEVWDADQKDKDSTTGTERGTAFNPNGSREDDEACATVSTGTAGTIDLSLNKAVSNDYPTIGMSVNYTLTLTNSGTIPATTVMVVDYLPQGLRYIWDTATTGPGITFNPSKLTWTVASVAPGQSVQLSLKAQVNQAGEWTNYAEVWDADQADVDSRTGDERGTPFNPNAPREDDEAKVSIWVGQPPATDAICYTIADNDNTPWNSQDVLSKLTADGRVETIVGRTGTIQAEGMAFNPWTGVLYASDARNFGTVNINTGKFTKIGEFGYGDGWSATGEYTNRGLLDVDGLAFDALNGDLWANVRKTGEPDLLFKVNPATGERIKDAFGTGKDFITILNNDGLNDIDDIAIDPTNGTLYAINNEDGQNSRLVTISKQTGWISAIRTLPLDNIEGLDFFGDGTLYATAGEGDEAIVIIDKNTWTTQIVTSIGTGGNRDYEAIACLTSPTNGLKVTVYEDVNEDGVRNADEVMLPGVDIELYRDVDGDGVIGPDDVYIRTGLSDSKGQVQFSTAANGAFVYRMAGGFVRGLGSQTPALLQGFGLQSDSYMGISASSAVAVDEEPEIPTEYQLYANYPNPFNPVTTIAFDLPRSERVNLAVFDVLGRRVAQLINGVTDAGQHEIRFDGSFLASGTYIYRMSTPNRTITRTMVLIK